MRVVRRAACALALALVALTTVQATTSTAESHDELQLYVEKFLRLCPKLIADAGSRTKLTSNLRRILYGSNPTHAAAANTELLTARYLQSRADVRSFRMLPDRDRADFAVLLTTRDGPLVWQLAESKAATGRRAGLFSFLESFEMTIEQPTSRTTLRAQLRRLLGSTSQLAQEVGLPDGANAGPGGIGFLSLRPATGRTAPEVAIAREQMQEAVRTVLGTTRQRQLLRETPTMSELVVLDGGADFDLPRIETAVLMRMTRQADGTYVENPPPLPRGGGLGAGLAGPAMLMALASMTTAQLGGVDFTNLGLRYVSDTAGDDGDRAVGYAFQAPTAGGRLGVVSQGIVNARQASNAFFVWLALPRSSFWVNLQPNQPDRVIDPTFGRTEAGKVLLQADLQLKHAMEDMLRPTTSTGARFWEGVVRDPSSPPCVSATRMWITPGVARVRDEGDQLYILDAPLTVRLETGYRPPPGAVRVPVCPTQSVAVNEHNDRQLRMVVLPALTGEVNTGTAFAPLRRVYLSRVAAEWYRQRSQTHPTAYDAIIDSGRVDRWLRQDQWRPAQTYDAYIRALRERAVRFTARVGGTEYRFAIGGVDFAGVPTKKVDAATFQRQYAALRTTSAWASATTDVDRAGVAKEFPRAAAPARPEPQRTGLDRPIVLLVGGFVLAGLTLLVVALARSRPRKVAHD